MAQTSPSDVFQYEVVLGLVDERLFDFTTLLNSGYVGDARTSAQMNVKGDTVTVIKSVVVDANLGVQVNPRSGSAVTADKVEFDSDDYTVNSKILAYDMDQRAMRILQNAVDPNSYMADEVMKRSSINIQAALLAAGVADGLEYIDTVGIANWKGLRRAVTLKWGEKQDALGPPLLICHPNVMFDITCTEEAMKSGVFGVNGVIESGKIYTFAGLNLMQLGAVTQNEDETYNNLIVTPGALQYFQDEQIGYYEQRKAHTTTWQLDWDFAYAAWLSEQKPNGAIVYKVATAIDAE
jgi:hypothetical protein